jgi:hypothetical protein
VDVASWRPSYNKRQARIFEVKVTRGDLLQDVKKGKWKKYLPFCETLIFAFPAGLAEMGEIPAVAGVWTWNEDKKSWTARRRGQRQTPTYSDEFWFAALLNQKGRVDKKLAEIRAAKNLAAMDGICLDHYYREESLGMSGLSSKIKAIVKENLKMRNQVENLEWNNRVLKRELEELRAATP